MGKFNRSSQHKQSAEWRNRGFKSSGNISQFDADSAESANHVEPVAGAKKIMKTKPKVLAKKNVLKGKIGHEVTAKKVKNKLPAPTEKMEEAAISETGAGSSVGEKELQKKTKVKTEGSATIAEEEAGDVVEGVDKVPGKRKKQKFKSYNLFVGNLSFDTTSEDIIKHFAKAGVPKSVRIPLKKEDNSPRGIAYIEFEDSVAYEKALSMHHTFLKRRRINVECTFGGSNKSTKRKALIKNKTLKLRFLAKEGKISSTKLRPWGKKNQNPE